VSHLDLDRLADLEEDLLTPDDAGEAEAHLRDCADCRGLQAKLRGTRTLLSELPPVEMPAAVSARIDAALSALPATTIVPLSSKRRGWRAHPTAAGLSAAAAVAALVAALVVGKTSSDSPSTQAGGRADTSGAAGTTRTSLPLPATSVSGTHYTAHNLDRSVSALLAPVSALAAAPETGGASPAPQSSSAKAATSPPAALSRLFTSPGALEACVRGIEGGPAVAPLAIDFATYQGAPAVLVVLPGLEQGKVDAWFVGANCTSTDPNLLRYRSLPDPNAPVPSPGG
jgi:hypothetical protein